MEQNVGEEARRQPEVLSSALVELPNFYFVKRDWQRIKARPRIGIKDSSAPLQFPQISIAAMGTFQRNPLLSIHPLHFLPESKTSRIIVRKVSSFCPPCFCHLSVVSACSAVRSLALQTSWVRRKGRRVASTRWLAASTGPPTTRVRVVWCHLEG